MKRLIIVFVLIFSSLLWKPSLADPVGIDADWQLLEDTIKQKLIDDESKLELYIEEGSLILKSNTEISKIYDFKQKDHDVYLILENGKKIIIIFNNVEKRLYQSELDNINFQELNWKFNSLISIIKNCDVDKYQFDYFLIENVTNNSFLVDFPVSKRPNGMTCGYFIGGGRCELAYDSKTGEWGKYNMMLLNYDLNYIGDISSIRSIYKTEKVCKFHDKISVLPETPAYFDCSKIKEGYCNGEIVYPLGDHYIGEFFNRKRHGKGNLYHRNKDIFYGYFEDGKKIKGIYLSKNKDSYNGKFLDDKKHGLGIFISADGKSLEGLWKNNEFTESFETEFSTPEFFLKSRFFRLSPEDRVKIQKHLHFLGFYNSSFDGLYGPDTEEALKIYHQEYFDKKKTLNHVEVEKIVLTLLDTPVNEDFD